MQNIIKLFRLFTVTAFLFSRVSCWSFIILIVLTMQMTGCGQIKFPPYTSEAFNFYKNQKTNNNLRIAILPLTDAKLQEKYFGVALTDIGVLPVFIIAENQNATQRFLLRDDLIYLQNAATKEIFPKAKQTDAADDDPNLHGKCLTAEIVTATSVLIVPVVSLGSLATSISLATTSVKIKAIQDNLFDKTLYTQVLSPGKSAEGFAFFKLSNSNIYLSDNKADLRDLVLHLQVTDESAQLTKDFELGLYN